MADWEWESFEEILNDRLFSITESGPLSGPIKKFSLKRDDKLQLILETVSSGVGRPTADTHPPGTVRVSTETVRLKHQYGASALLIGVQRFAHLGHSDFLTGESELQERSFVHAAEAELDFGSEQTKACYIIDWLDNVDSRRYIWPASIEDEVVIEKVREISANTDGPTLKEKTKSRSSGSSCVKIEIAGLVLYLVASSSNRENKRGFILYMDMPGEELREKVRNCLSFALGMYLVYLGHSVFDQNWNLRSFRAESAYGLEGRAFGLAVLPPAHLGLRWQNDINPGALNRLVNALYASYEDLEFGHLSWMYWHAVIAPVHAAGSQFGALIEALQRIYLSRHESVRKLLLDNEWEALRSGLLEKIGEKKIDPKIRQILVNKTLNLNEAPQSVVSERLFSMLQLELSDKEKEAWKQRNNASHGRRTKPDQYINLIRDIKLLKIRFHRMVLRMTNASENYYDYYTVGHPVRRLGDLVP